MSADLVAFPRVRRVRPVADVLPEISQNPTVQVVGNGVRLAMNHVFTTHELRRFACFLVQLADRIDGGAE